MKLSFPVDKGQYISDSTGLSYSVCSNLYPSNPVSEGSSSRGGLFTFNGSSSYWLHGNQNTLGTYVFDFNGTMLAVLQGIQSTFFNVEALLYSIESGVGTLIGSFGNVSGAPSYANNGMVACFVFPESNKSFFYDPDSGLSQITDSVFQGYEAETGGIRSVDEDDGFFLFNTSKTFFKSSLVSVNKGRDFDATDFVKPFLKENAICVKSINGEVYLFGENNTKVYSNIGGPDFPYLEIPGAEIQKGAVSHRTVSVFDNSFFFIGSGLNETNAVYRGVGGGAVAKISTDYIDKQLADPNADELSVYAYMNNGRAFVSARSRSSPSGPVPPDQKSVYGGVYDVVSSATKGFPVWLNFDYLSYDSVVEVANDIYSCDVYGVYQIDESVVIGTPSFTSQYLYAQSDPLIINRLELVMEVGVGAENATDEDAVNPSVLLEFSDDGAKTWSSAGSQSVGRFGQYKNRLVWPMLGLAPQSRIFRFTADTKVPLRFHRIDMEVEKGFLYG